MSDARLMQILASLARRSPLRTLQTICETQHQISTRKLEQYLEPIGDELAGFAFNLRQDYDAIRTENQRLAGEVAKLREALRAIDRHNDSPARFDKLINDTVRTALSTANGEVTG